MATEYDYWKIFPRMPKKVMLGDITVRDGFQHEEKFISTEAKIFYAEEMALPGCREIELTNLGNPAAMPQFKDTHEVFKYFKQGERFKKRCARAGINPGDITFTGVTIREPAVDTAIEMKKEGYGPDSMQCPTPRHTCSICIRRSESLLRRSWLPCRPDLPDLRQLSANWEDSLPTFSMMFPSGGRVNTTTRITATLVSSA